MIPWGPVLDEFERTLAAQRAAIARGEHDQVVAFTPPSGLGPLPPELLRRAEQLAAEAEQLTAALDGARAEVGRQLQLLHTVSASRPAGQSQFLDSRA